MVPALSILPCLTKQTSTNKDLAMFQWDFHTCNDYISVLTVPVILLLIVSVVLISNAVRRSSLVVVVFLENHNRIHVKTSNAMYTCSAG